MYDVVESELKQGGENGDKCENVGGFLQVNNSNWALDTPVMSYMIIIISLLMFPYIKVNC